MSDLTERERKKRSKLAREYKDKGYSVFIEPSDADLPGFLQGFRPDLIASSDTENVIIEIKSSETIGDSEYLSDLARIIEPQGNWRLELVITNPKEVSKSKFEDELLSKHDLAERIITANRLENEGFHEAAILLLWSVIESLLRNISLKENIYTSSVDSRALVKKLYSTGIIDEKIQSFLDSVAIRRNSIIHGYRSESFSQTSYRELVSIAKDFLSEID